MKTESFFFINESGFRLAGRLFVPDSPNESCVIFCHGLFSTKDGYKITRLTEGIVRAGFALFTFDFSCAGDSDGNIEDLSIFQEIRDLESAVSFCRNRGFEEIHLFGSSMGALVCLLYAQHHADGIASISLIAPPLDLRGLYKKAAGISNLATLPDDGKTQLDGVVLRNSFFKEALAIFPEEAARSITMPVLIIHGEKDEVVDVENAFRLMRLLAVNRKLVVIGDGDHNLTRPKDIEIIACEIVHNFHTTSRRT